MTLFKSLTHRPFALLWSGQTVSRLGDSLYQIALAWWVVEKTGSATAMGMVFIFSFIPTMGFVLIGGITADRFPRVLIMLLSDLLRGVVVAGVAVLAFAHQLDVWHVYLASLLFGSVNAFFLPAYTALLPETVPAEALPSANSLHSLSAEISGVAGPALGALMVGLGGAPLAFALDGLSFFVSAICLWPLLQLSASRSLSSQKNTGLEDVRQGFRMVFAFPWLWMTIGMVALLNLTGRSPMNVALPFLVKNSLHAEAGTLGLLYATFSFGSIVGAAWIGRRPPLRRRGRIVYGMLVIVGVMTLALGLSVTLIGVGLAIFILAISLETSNLVWSHLLQERIPRDRLGRVASLNLLGSTALLPIGFGLTGLATDQFGSPWVFVMGGALTAGLAVLGLVQPAIWDLD